VAIPQEAAVQALLTATSAVKNGAPSARWKARRLPVALRTAAERYLADTTAEAAAALAQAADPPRQELLRRMNMAPGGTGALIAMRSELTAHLHDEPELKLLDADLRHLLE
jgi:hypothetical protein